MKRTTFTFVVISFILIMALPDVNHAQRQRTLNRDIIKATEQAFDQEPRAVRPDHPMIPTTYIEDGEAIYYYVIPRRLQRLSEAGERFTIKKIRYKSDYVDIEFQSDSGAKPRIRIFPEKDITQEFYDTIVPAVLRDLFVFGDRKSHLGIIGNSEYKVAHLAGANHLPVQDLREAFPTLQEAEAAGYRPCTICFEAAHWIPLEGYIAIRKRALEAARLEEVAFPPVADMDLQEEIQKIGERIVSNFPIATKGYDYVFKVLHSEMPWAESFPTGFVFLSDRLIEMIEDPAEMEFVLAHEIAHVELFIKEASKDPLDSTERIETYLELRAYEHETDFTALIYLAQTYRDPRSLHAAITALRKMQFYQETVPVREASIYDSHPSIRERVAYLEDNFVIPWEPCPVFCDIEDGEVVVTAEVLGVILVKDVSYQGIVRDIPRLILRVSATDLMNKAGKIPGGGSALVEGGTAYKLRRSEYPKMVGRNQSRIFCYDVKNFGRLELELIVKQLTNITGLDLGNIGGANDWKVCKEQPPE